ncbi:unnamed protein product, partial [Staurois parvus]
MAYTAEEWHAWVPSTKEASPKAHAQKSPPIICQGPCTKRRQLQGLWSGETKINVFGTDSCKTGLKTEYKEKCMVLTVKRG